MNLPISSAYWVAPVAVVAFSIPGIIRSENPALLVLLAAVEGLLCAVALHAYVLVRGWFTRPVRSNDRAH